jgi:hypothetical protein
MPPKRVKTDLEKVGTKDLLRSIKRNIRERLREAQASATRTKKGKR